MTDARFDETVNLPVGKDIPERASPRPSTGE
jgi:hypothetical protein